MQNATLPIMVLAATEKLDRATIPKNMLDTLRYIRFQKSVYAFGINKGIMPTSSAYSIRLSDNICQLMKDMCEMLKASDLAEDAYAVAVKSNIAFYDALFLARLRKIKCRS